MTELSPGAKPARVLVVVLGRRRGGGGLGVIAVAHPGGHLDLLRDLLRLLLARLHVTLNMLCQHI